MGIVWSERMSVGVPALDADHRTLIALVNGLQRSIGDAEEYATLASVLQALGDYADHHFSREESVMRACHYPALALHHDVHVRLAGQVHDLNERYGRDPSSVNARDCLAFLNRWLIEHICSTDMDYRGWVVGKGDLTQAVDSAGSIVGGGVGGTFDWRRLKVLVVDDNRNFCEVLRAILGGVGVPEVAECNDLDTAYAALSGQRFDVVISDWHVGRESGLDLAGWIRRQGNPDIAGLPVLMLSAHERLSNHDVAIAAGADEFMEKPISARGLLIVLARLLIKAKRDRE